MTAKSAVNWVLYDAECPWCAGMARRWAGALRRRGWALAPLQASWVRARLGLPEDRRPDEMAVWTARGEVLGGADAVIELARHFWWARGLPLLARLPMARALLRAAYRWVAARRPCANGPCRLPSPAPAPLRPWRLGLIALALPVLAVIMTWRAPGWVAMVSVALALFAALKWLMWRTAVAGVSAGTATPRKPGFLRITGFLLGWAGMDAAAFFDSNRSAFRPEGREWRQAAIRTVLGAALVWSVAHHRLAMPPLAVGWLGMTGLVCGLHFGLFHLLSLAWRSAGIQAAPIMNAPWHGTSLAEFWGRRWNLGFSVPARRLLLQPLAGRVGHRRAMLAVFIVSGLLHELVISLPARAGFGLPLAYFTFQGLALALERSGPGRRWGLGRGRRGRLFTLGCVAGPAFWLFHPPFVRGVILPLLERLGAI